MRSAKPLLYVLLVFPFLFLVPVVLSMLAKPLSLFPWDKRVFNVDAYSDGENLPVKHGSTIDSFKVDADSISMEYTLRDEEEYPYAGIFFSMSINGKYTDLSGYDYMKITMSVGSPDVYQVKITTLIDGFTDENDSNTYCPLEKTVYVGESMSEYRIALPDFGILSWWFEDAGLEPGDYDVRRQLTNVYQINLQQTKPPEHGSEQKGSFSIKAVSIHRSYGLLYAMSGSGFVATLMICVILFIRFRKKFSGREATPSGEFHPVTLDSYEEIDTKRISSIIEKDYTNPGLSVAMLYEETGISRQRIASLVKKKYGLPFKQLVNKIRLKEAIRLLVETDRNITDIAMALGFGGPSYFFQVFKGEYRMSPSEYRKKYS